MPRLAHPFLAYTLLLAAVPAVASAQTAPVMLAPEQATIPFAPGAGSATSAVAVTLNAVDPAEVTLQASPLVNGDAYGFIHFIDIAGHDTIRLDAASLHCARGVSCSVPFVLTGLWPAGLYKGAIAAAGPGEKTSTVPITAVRLSSSFHPTVSSTAMHDGRIEVDVDGPTPANVLLSIQNPAGSPPHRFELVACTSGAAADCTAPQRPESALVNFWPASFSLEPGTTQAVSAAVLPCPTANSCASTMLVRDADGSGPSVSTVISVNQHQRIGWRQLVLFIATVAGAVLSVVVNNLVPTTRSKQGARETVRRLEDRLHECPNAGAALLDSLQAEATRLKLVLNQISFTDPAKETDLQSAHQSLATLTATMELARRLSVLRADADGAVLSLASHASIRGKLLDAEEALLVSDADSATARLNEAQAQLVQARNDAEQAALRKALPEQIAKFMKERGWKAVLAVSGISERPAAPPVPASEQALLAQNQQQSRAADSGGLDASDQTTQRLDRDPFIAGLVRQLTVDIGDYEKLNSQDLLDLERDFYISNVWTEYVERKLDEFRKPPVDETACQNLDARKQEWIEFSKVFLNCLRKSPKADQTQRLIELLRYDTTLEDIRRGIEGGKALIECDSQPKYLEPVDFALVITEPFLHNVAAVRRLLSYRWSFDDGSSAPPDVDRCRHYFRYPRRRWFGAVPEITRKLVVTVSVPFTNVSKSFEATVIPGAARSLRPSRVAGSVAFATTTAIAVVTAFSNQYASSLPHEVDWSNCFNAFLLGFAFDQVRDKMAPSSPAISPVLSPAPTPNSAPHAAPGSAGTGH